MQQKYDDYSRPPHTYVAMPQHLITTAQPFIAHPDTAYSKFPLFFNIYAFLCCPFGAMCALSGLASALMGYSEYRVQDADRAERYNRRARNCAFVSVGFGIFCIAVIIIAYVVLYWWTLTRQYSLQQQAQMLPPQR